MSRFTAATSGASRWSAMNAVLMDEAVVGEAIYHRVALEAHEKLRPAPALTMLEENLCRVMAQVYDPLSSP